MADAPSSGALSTWKAILVEFAERIRRQPGTCGTKPTSHPNPWMWPMIIFSLGMDEAVVVGDDVLVKVFGIDGDEVWIEIDRPDDVPVEQGETNWLDGELEAVL